MLKLMVECLWSWVVIQSIENKCLIFFFVRLGRRGSLFVDHSRRVVIEMIPWVS